MRYKKIMMLTIIFTCLLAVSTVSAEENATNDMVSVESQEIEQMDNEEVISTSDEGTFTALQKKINDAVSGSTITLENDYTFDEGFAD